MKRSPLIKDSLLKKSNDYFVNIRPTLAKIIPIVNKTPSEYMKNKITNSLSPSPVTENTINDILIFLKAWWRHQMESFSAQLALCAGNSPATGEFPAQRPVTRSFDVFFYLCLNKRLSKQSWGWWFETPSCSLWRHCNGLCCWLWWNQTWTTQDCQVTTNQTISATCRYKKAYTLKNLIKTLNARGPSYIGLTTYRGCWWPNSLRRQDISTHHIDYVENVNTSLCFPWKK